MVIVLVGTFALPFSIDRKRLTREAAFNENKITEFLKVTRSNFDISLGSLPQSYFLPLTYTNTSDSGSLFEKHYLAKIHITNGQLLKNVWNIYAKKTNLNNLFKKNIPKINLSITLLDRDCGIISITIDATYIDFELASVITQHSKTLSDGFLKELWEQGMSDLIFRLGEEKWIVKYNPANFGNVDRDVFMPVSAWAHVVYELNLAQTKHLKNSPSTLLINRNVSDFLKSDGNFFGWGQSVVCSNSQKQWFDGIALAQFYYFCFSRLSREITMMFHKSTREINFGSMRGFIYRAQNLNSVAFTLIAEFKDAELFLAGEPAESFKQLLHRWDLSKLTESINIKIPLLQQLITSTIESIRRRSATIIEFILFATAMASIVSLSISMHDYLKTGNPQTTLNLLIARVVSNSFQSILNVSFVFVSGALIVFILAKTGLIQNIFRRIARFFY